VQSPGRPGIPNKFVPTNGDSISLAPPLSDFFSRFQGEEEETAHHNTAARAMLGASLTVIIKYVQKSK
jgi:hypothetical protein